MFQALKRKGAYVADTPRQSLVKYGKVVSNKVSLNVAFSLLISTRGWPKTPRTALERPPWPLGPSLAEKKRVQTHCGPDADSAVRLDDMSYRKVWRFHMLHRRVRDRQTSIMHHHTIMHLVKRDKNRSRDQTSPVVAFALGQEFSFKAVSAWRYHVWIPTAIL